MPYNIDKTRVLHRHSSHARKELLHAATFTMLLVGFTLSMVILSISSVSERIILGTELNGDGSVEYLCLGTHCENLNRMDW